MSPDQDDDRAGASGPVSNVVPFRRSGQLLAPLESPMTKAKALHIRRKILNDNLPEQLLDEMLRLLEERERS